MTVVMDAMAWGVNTVEKRQFTGSGLHLLFTPEGEASSAAMISKDVGASTTLALFDVWKGTLAVIDVDAETVLEPHKFATLEH